MPINVEIKVMPFGQIRLEIGRLIAPVEEHPAAPVHREMVRYHQPQESASRIYEVQYGEEAKNYIVPFSTG